MKKLLCFLLIYSILLLTSCSSPERVTKNYEPFQNHTEDVEITLKDSTKYSFEKYSYSFESDSLVGLDFETQKPVKVAMQDITTIDMITSSFAPLIVLIGVIATIVIFSIGLKGNFSLW